MVIPYDLGAEALAPRLLGCILERTTPTGLLRARIVETEAYLGEHDGASHARAGRTSRTAVMYGPPGRAYVYLCYGIHEMFNVVCAAEGDPQAVLVRAAVALGHDARLDGPGRLTKGLAIDRRLDGHDLSHPPLRITPGLPARYTRTARVGVAYAGSWARRRLRFVAQDAKDSSMRRLPHPWTS